MIVSENLASRVEPDGIRALVVPFQHEDGPREFVMPEPLFTWVDLDNFPVLPGDGDAAEYGATHPILREQEEKKFLAPIAFGIIDFMARELFVFGCTHWDISIALGMKSGDGDDPTIITGRFKDPDALSDDIVMGMLSTQEYGLLASTPDFEKQTLEPLSSKTWLDMYYIIRRAVQMGAKELKIVFQSAGVDISYRDEGASLSAPGMANIGGMWMTSRISL